MVEHSGVKMRIKSTEYNGRKAWLMDNGALDLVMLQGGGHIASMTIDGRKQTNPFWVPPWKTIEPWAYRARDAARYDIPLLASICGHNLCLGWFGEPSPDEAKAGMSTHGEAPVARWRMLKKSVGKNRASLTCGCELPAAGMKFSRTLSTSRESSVVTVKEKVQNLSKRDVPYTMCQHVTIGPPFLEKGVTLFDMPATRSHTFPGEFSDRQRLKSDKAFFWPHGPGAKGEKVDMRMISRKYRVSADFSTNLIDQSKEDAWLSVLNPKQGALLCYVWKRSDFPWVGNWEENYGRKGKPWSGKALTRGMEFTNTPFPVSLREALTMGTFQNEATYRWLPARGTTSVEYDIILMDVPGQATGVADVRRKKKGFSVDLMA